MKPIDPTKTHELLQHKHDRPLTACRFDPTGRYVFFGAEDNLVHRFDLQTKTATPLAAHDSWVRALGFGPRCEGVAVVSEGNHGTSDTILYTGGYDGRLIFWPAAADKPQPLRTIEAHHGWLRALAVSPDGARIATCGNDNLVKLWDAANGKLLADLSGHTSHVYNVAFNPTGETLVSCDLKGVVKEWDVSSGALHRDLTPATALYKYDTSFRADIGGARSLAFSTDGKWLALGGITNVTNAFAGIGHALIALIDMDSGKVAQQLEAKDKVNGTAWGVAYHPAGFWLTLTGGGGGGWLYFFQPQAPVGNALPSVPQSAAKDATTKNNSPKDNNSKDAVTTTNDFFKLKLPTDGRDLSLSPDKTQVAVAHADKTLRLYALHEK
jgi:WD40 repeat protein